MRISELRQTEVYKSAHACLSTMADDYGLTITPEEIDQHCQIHASFCPQLAQMAHDYAKGMEEQNEDLCTATVAVGVAMTLIGIGAGGVRAILGKDNEQGRIAGAKASVVALVTMRSLMPVEEAKKALQVARDCEPKLREALSEYINNLPDNMRDDLSAMLTILCGLLSVGTTAMLGIYAHAEDADEAKKKTGELIETLKGLLVPAKE